MGGVGGFSVPVENKWNQTEDGSERIRDRPLTTVLK